MEKKATGIDNGVMCFSTFTKVIIFNFTIICWTAHIADTLKVKHKVVSF